MLDDEARWAGGRVPALDERQREVVERASAAYRAMPLETSADAFVEMAAKLAVAFPNHRLNTDEAKARTALYGEHLRDIPPDMLDQAVNEWMRTSEFFPRIADLRALAYRLPRPPRYRRQKRLALLLSASDARALPAPVDLVDPAEVAAFLSVYGVDPGQTERREAVVTAAGARVARPAARMPSEEEVLGLFSGERTVAEAIAAE